jgi:DNA-binding response OmpR family regulator
MVRRGETPMTVKEFALLEALMRRLAPAVSRYDLLCA